MGADCKSVGLRLPRFESLTCHPGQRLFPIPGASRWGSVSWICAARHRAVKAVPGSTAGAVEAETNEGAAVYGVIVTKSDGTKLEVHLDKNYKFLGTEAPDNDEH